MTEPVDPPRWIGTVWAVAAAIVVGILALGRKRDGLVAAVRDEFGVGWWIALVPLLALTLYFKRC